MKEFSLRRRLLQVVLITVTVAWVASAVLTYEDAHRGIDEVLDAHLAQSAELLIAQGGHELEEIDIDELAAAGPYSQRLAFQVWENGAELVLRSAEAPPGRLSAVERGFSEADAGGKRWRVYSNWDRRHRWLIQVAEDHATRVRIARRLALNTLWPMLAGLPVLAILIWWLISRVLRPVSELGVQISQRDAASLAPLTAQGLPAEIAPLVDRLNNLFARISASLESERRFTANAAHELRNPLAALRAQAEVARAATDDAVRRSALDKLLEGCERMSRLVGQLLLLARIEQEQEALKPVPCRLADLARGVIADLAPDAVAAQVDIGFSGADSLTIAGDPVLLGALVRNLADNAVRHAGPRSRVEVSVTSRDHAVVLQVLDNGPGVDEAERHQLGRRFYRGSTAAGIGGGLGLSIVARIAELHGASVAFSSGLEGHGLGVSVVFPAAGQGRVPPMAEAG